MHCCFLGNKSRRKKRGPVNGSSLHVAPPPLPVTSESDEDLYVEPYEVPESVRRHPPMTMPPPPPLPPMPLHLAGGDLHAGEMVYAELETGALNIPSASLVNPPTSLHQPHLLLAPSPAPMQTSVSGDLDECGNVIYSDIVGVLVPA